MRVDAKTWGIRLALLFGVATVLGTSAEHRPEVRGSGTARMSEAGEPLRAVVTIHGDARAADSFDFIFTLDAHTFTPVRVEVQPLHPDLGPPRSARPPLPHFTTGVFPTDKNDGGPVLTQGGNVNLVFSGDSTLCATDAPCVIAFDVVATKPLDDGEIDVSVAVAASARRNFVDRGLLPSCKPATEEFDSDASIETSFE